MPQQNKHGELTHRLALDLRSLLVDGSIDKSSFCLFYHPHRGMPDLDRPVRNGLIKLQFDSESKPDIELTRCDIMIVSVQEHRAILLIEVEESKDGAPPKTVFGDTYGVWMASAVSLKKKRGIYKLSNTTLWTVVFEPEEGGKYKQYVFLQDCFEKLQEPFQKLLHGTVHVTSTEVVRVKGGPESLSNTVISKMRRDLVELFA